MYVMYHTINKVIYIYVYHLLVEHQEVRSLLNEQDQQAMRWADMVEDGWLGSAAETRQPRRAHPSSTKSFKPSRGEALKKASQSMCMLMCRCMCTEYTY